jgi:hypothetical protein
MAWPVMDERDGGHEGVDERASREPQFVRSFERGLAVIRALSSSWAGLTIAEVARETG